jgi:hypothetical protein
VHILTVPQRRLEKVLEARLAELGTCRGGTGPEARQLEELRERGQAFPSRSAKREYLRCLWPDRPQGGQLRM